MTLQGKEEETDLTIVLYRTIKWPTTEANKLVGLWKFDSIFVDDKEASDSLNPTKKMQWFLKVGRTLTCYTTILKEKNIVFLKLIVRENK